MALTTHAERNQSVFEPNHVHDFSWLLEAIMATHETQGCPHHTLTTAVTAPHCLATRGTPNYQAMALPGNPRNARLHCVTFGAFVLSRRRFCGAFDLTRRLTFASCFRSCASESAKLGGGVPPASWHLEHRPRGGKCIHQQPLCSYAGLARPHRSTDASSWEPAKRPVPNSRWPPARGWERGWERVRVFVEAWAFAPLRSEYV